MKRFALKSLTVAALAVLAAFSTESAFAQASKVVADKITFEDLPSPQFSGGGKDKSFKPKNWLEIETKLRISLRPEPASKTLDRLTIKWYVAVKNPEKSGTMLLLTRDVDHVNVPLEEDIYCSVYISPSSLKRLTGSDRGGKSAIEYVGYEVLVAGEKKAEGTSKGTVGWWNVASDKISRTDAVPLLNKNETPFSNMWWDRYAEVAVERR